MTIVNRRNAVVGWLTLKAGKALARRKARQVGGRLTSWRSQKNRKRSNGTKARGKERGGRESRTRSGGR